MAYEDLTYEVILQRMMNTVMAQNPNLDNREGSIIFNALASAAVELAIMYTEMDNSRNESFVKTASREYILQGCQDMGMDTSVFEAHSGTFKGEFNVEVEIASRWNCGLYNYAVYKYLGKEGEYHTYEMICETLGTDPNNNLGSLTAITDIPDGLTHAELTECLVEGENETSDEDVISAYYDFVNSSDEDGNVTQYYRWCDEFDGIGNAKVFPLWNGANTVKVSILTASNRAVDTSVEGNLVEKFQNHLDPGITGMGNGVAPIGAFVTVSTATEKPINVSANVTLKKGYTDLTPINEALTKYMGDIAYDKTIVAYMNVGAIILGVEGVEAINNLKINNGTADIPLGDEEIPILGTVNWTVDNNV